MPFEIYRDLYYCTFTILKWKRILNKKDNIKIVTDTILHLYQKSSVVVFAFVIMPDHIHILWQILEPFNIAQVKHSFLSYTSKKLMTNIRDLNEFKVGKTDRYYQIWKSPSLCVEITTPKFLHQKMDYIHNNPMAAELCLNEDYKYSSFRSYLEGESEFDFLTLW